MTQYRGTVGWLQAQLASPPDDLPIVLKDAERNGYNTLWSAEETRWWPENGNDDGEECLLLSP